jgi:hypothetical protein
MKRALLPAFCLLGASCVGSTGGELVDFQAAAAGPEGAVAGEPLHFQTARGWQVELTTARLRVGALYLSNNLPASGSQRSSCILPGSYVAQVVDGRDIDLLSSKPQLFPVLGHGTTLEPARAAQVWLTGGDVNSVDDPPQPTVILELAGSARSKQGTLPFQAKLTIANNRISTGSAAAGADPICIERIVSPIPTAVQVETEGALLLRIDPRLLFTNVDFSQLPPATDGSARSFTDAKEGSDQPSVNLYNNLKQAGPLYAFSWVPSLK